MTRLLTSEKNVQSLVIGLVLPADFVERRVSLNSVLRSQHPTNESKVMLLRTDAIQRRRLHFRLLRRLRITTTMAATLMAARRATQMVSVMLQDSRPIQLRPLILLLVLLTGKPSRSQLLLVVAVGKCSKSKTRCTNNIVVDD